MASNPVPPQLEDAVWTALGLVYVSGTDCGEMCSLDRLGRLVRPRSGRKTRRLWPQTADFISEDVPSVLVLADDLHPMASSRELPPAVVVVDNPEPMAS